MPIRNLTLTLLLFMVCSAALADDAADRQAIESSAQQWVKAFHAQSATALASLATADVLVLNGAGRPVQGTIAACQAWIRAAAMTRDTLVSTTKEIVISGDTAWRIGLLAYQQSGGEPHHGQVLEIWKRTDAGWKLHRQMSSNILEATLRPTPSEPMLDRPTH
jgi:ketosteroid isomerase-like protein